jgi:DNA-binding beta-propeller fold protein YncE
MLTRIVEDRVYDYARVVGGRSFMGIYTIALGHGDDVYAIVRMPYAAKVVKLTIGTMPDDEEIIVEFGKRGEDEGDFVWPAGLAVDSQQNVFVTDEWLNRVNVYTANGEYLRTCGTSGNGDGQFNRPSGIAIDGNDDLYISDSLNHRVQKLSNDGRYINQRGRQGTEAGEFNSPWGITTDDQGDVYVADHKNHRIQKFSANGDFVFQFGSHGKGDDQFDHPSSVAVDSDGEIYVCDWANDRVQTFDRDRNFLTSFEGNAQDLSKWQRQYVSSNPDVYKARRRVYSLEPEQRFALPMAVAFDNEKSRLMVVDSQRWRIQMYNKLRDYADPQFNI